MNTLTAQRNESLAWRPKPKYTAVYGMLKTNPAQRAAFMGRICFSKWDLFKRKLNGYKELTLTITQKMKPVFMPALLHGTIQIEKSFLEGPGSK